MILGRFRISGHSMQPTYQEGDELLATSLLPVRIRDVVVFKYDSEVFIKRVKSIKGNMYELIGDNMFDSYDSRKFGKVKKSDIMGKVILVISH